MINQNEANVFSFICREQVCWQNYLENWNRSKKLVQVWHNNVNNKVETSSLSSFYYINITIINNIMGLNYLRK